MNMINAETHFNFVKMHLLSHFCDKYSQFRNIPIYSMEIAEITHKTQIKQGWQQSNKNDAGRQIVHSYGGQHAIRIRLLNLESPQDHSQGLSADVLQHLDRTTSTVSQPVIRRRILKRCRDDVSNVDDFSRISRVLLDIIYRALIQYSRHNLRIDHSLPEAHAILRSLHVELLTQLEITVLAFQEHDVYEINRARSTAVTGSWHWMLVLGTNDRRVVNDNNRFV